MPRRTLSLKREVLQELSDADLHVVAGGTVPQTWYSCLDYLSCNVLGCVLRDTAIVTTAIHLTGVCD
jgi:hypothetical protein